MVFQAGSRLNIVTCIIVYSLGSSIGENAVAANPKIRDHASIKMDIPFEPCGSLVFLKVKVNGSRPLSFILDSGASADCVDVSLAKKMGLKLEGETAGTGAGEGTYEVKFVKDVKLGVFGTSLRANRTVEFNDEVIAAIDFSGLESIIGRRVDGLLGYNFLNKFVVQIDYDHHIVRVFDPSTFVPENETALPLAITDGIPFVKGLLKLPSGENISGNFMIDTGSQDSVDSGAVDKAAGRLEVTGGVGLGRERRGSVLRAATFAVGSYSFAKIVAGGGRDMFGGEVCRRFLLTFDYAHKRVLLRPGEHYNDPSLFDASGLELRYKRTGFEVHFVINSSAAETSGLEKGDVIESINGIKCEKIGFQEALELFRQPDRLFRLKVGRGTKALDVSLNTRALL